MVAGRKRTLDPKVFVSKRHCVNHATGLCEACRYSSAPTTVQKQINSVFNMILFTTHGLDLATTYLHNQQRHMTMKEERIESSFVLPAKVGDPRQYRPPESELDGAGMWNPRPFSGVRAGALASLLAALWMNAELSAPW